MPAFPVNVCPPRRRLRRAGWLAGALAAVISAAPARALEEVVIEIPLLDTRFTLRLSELARPGALRAGSSDLAELDRVSNGVLGRQLRELLLQPVPLGLKQAAASSLGAPLLEQAMLVLSSLGTIEGQSPDLSGRTLQQALQQAAADGEPTLLALMQAIPGKRLTVHLQQAYRIARRMARQRQQAEALLATALAAAPPAAAGTAAGTAAPSPTSGTQRRSLSLPVAHRSTPLELLLLEPARGGNGRLVLISHGLWDDPAGFEGWARLLASRGYSVLLPRHPGSDSSQQQSLLGGRAAPPGPEELALRPRDLSAVLDGVAQQRITLSQRVDPERVVVLGHSWGATTALQLAGMRPKQEALRERCGALDDPGRNLSWTLQCSWLRGIDRAALQDARVIAVGAVSPPVSLLFPPGSGAGLSARVLLVSGSRDWVVPPDPEAVEPMRWGGVRGNQLVLVQGGDHFNLRPLADGGGGELGPLLLAWSDAAFAAGDAARPREGAAPLLAPGSWRGAGLPMADVTGLLRRR